MPPSHFRISVKIVSMKAKIIFLGVWRPQLCTRGLLNIKLLLLFDLLHCNVAYQAVFLKYVNLYNLIYWGAHNQPRVSILVSAMAMILFSWGTFWFSVMFMYEV